MNFIVFSNKSIQAEKLKIKTIALLKEINFHNITKEEDLVNLDLLITIGGDGAVLHAFHCFYTPENHKQIKLLPVQLDGSSGRIATYKANYLDFIQNYFKKDQFIIKTEAVLKITINNQNFYALNEIKIFDYLKPINFPVFIDKKKIFTHFGSGVIFTTSLGSTGYSKSFHGPIIFDNSKLYLFSEIAPVNNNRIHSLNSYLILDKEKKVSFQINPEQLKTLKIITDIFEIKIKDSKKPLNISISLVHDYLKLLVDKNNHETLIYEKLNELFL